MTICSNLFIRFLISLPVILITLYFIPFLGVCLCILKLFIDYSRNKKIMAVCFIVLGIFIFVPRIIYLIPNLKSTIPDLELFLNHDIYLNGLVPYGKRLIILGVIFYVVSYIISYISIKSYSALNKYMAKQINRDNEIRKENDLVMQEKREKAKNTKVIKCPYCGADNTLTSTTGVCAFCRKNLNNK